MFAVLVFAVLAGNLGLTVPLPVPVSSLPSFLLLAANELENLNETQSALNADYRKLKAQAARDQFEGRKPKQRKGRSKQKKRVFDPRHVNDFGGGDETPVELTTSTKKKSLG